MSVQLGRQPRSAVALAQNALEHLHDHLLLGFGQAVEPLDLLLQQRRGPSLGGAGFMQSQKLIDTDAKELRERGLVRFQPREPLKTTA